MPKNKNIFEKTGQYLPKKKKIKKSRSKGIDKWENAVYNDGMKARVSL